MQYVSFLFFLLVATSASAQQPVINASELGAHTRKMTHAQYIERFSHIAVADMEKYGIPASIKMAQGILESDCGNSRLATIGNNHFGIKCKTTWMGETISHDDDAPGECFRQYATAEESWADHSKFLDEGDRYNALFELDPTDYKAWARGLKDAGYATNPRYPELLVKIIEDHELWKLDRGVEMALAVPREDASADSVAGVQDSDVPDYEAGAAGVSGNGATSGRKSGSKSGIPESISPRRPAVTPKGGTPVDPDNFTVEL